MSDGQPARCFICGGGNEYTIEEHHAVPRRLSGSDSEENLYFLCGTCHNAVEAIYDDDFYRRLGVAVDQVEDGTLSERRLGTKVEPGQSIDREIPQNSDHISSESWWVTVTVETIEDDCNIQTNIDETVEKRVREYLKENVASLLEKYERLLDESATVTGYYERADQEMPEYVDEEAEAPVSFTSVPDNNREIPAVKVQNASRDCFDRSHQEFRATSSRGRGPHHHLRTVGVNGSEEYESEYYRLHCAYCHTVFTQDEHSDMARHLRLHHGIENPYEVRDSAFSDSEMSEVMDYD